MKIKLPPVLALLLLLGTTLMTHADPSVAELPIQRILTDMGGRKLDVIILEKHNTTVTVRRTSDSKVHNLDLDKFSEEDRKFANGLSHTPPASSPTSGSFSPGQTQMEMTVCGVQTKVTRVGNGPVGVIFFGHTGWDSIITTIVDGASEFDGLLSEKTSFFLWEYPREGPFKENSRALDKYDEGDSEKFRPDFKGIATNVVAQIRQQTGIKQFLLVGNSLGAGVILWDFPELVKDSSLKFLLISPTEPFMPLVSDLVKLQRTMLLTGVEDPASQKEFPDRYMKGKDACRWAKANTDSSAIKKMNESLSDPVMTSNGNTLPQRGRLDGRHIIIGSQIKLPVLAKLIKVNLGLAPCSILAKPQQTVGAQFRKNVSSLPLIMITNSQHPEWLQKALPTIESAAIRYQSFTQEQQIWLWIISLSALLLLTGVVSYLIYWSFRSLNNLLQSSEGWRPINFKSWMWVGTGIWLLLVARQMHQDQNPGWSVATVCGFLTIIGFGWFMIRRLKWCRAIGAFIANSCVGIILAPLVIQWFFLILILIVACILWWIYCLFAPRRVVYMKY